MITQKSEFKKEVRYVVLKLSKMTDEQKTALGAALSEINLMDDAMPDCVVVESDWPNYQDTWSDIQAVCECRFISRAELQAERDQMAADYSEIQADRDNLQTELFNTQKERAALAAKIARITDVWVSAGMWPDTFEEKNR